jgi:penicillin-binding protein 1A
VTDRFPDPDPQEPPPTFRADLQEQPPTFRADLPRARKRRFGTGARVSIAATLALVLSGVLAAAFVKLAYLSDLPPIPTADALWSLNRAPGVTFLDRTGVKIATRGPRNGRRVSLAELPAYAPKAFLAAEDRRFYRHGALDLKGLARAAFADLRAGRIVQGGSSLNQQLAKSLFLTPDQTFKRKVQEAALAIELDRRLTKDQVLELYLNRIFFGASAYGVEAASETYFGKPASSLSLAEAALLAALPKAPSRLSPALDMAAALNRSRLILHRMAKEGWISKADEQRALAAPPALAPDTPEDEDFGYVLDLAQSQAAELSQGKAPDLVVQLSIDAPTQTTAALIVRRMIEAQGRAAGAHEAALVALAPDGGVRALVGGVDHRFSRFDRATQAQRQPGSAFKPFVYAAALESGVAPTDIRKDAPVRMGPWTPANYGGGYAGAVTVEDALVRSINTVAVRLAKEAGPDRIGDIDQRFGLVSIPARPGLTVALGAYEINLLELTSGYQVFQQDGRRQKSYLIERITTSSGQEIWARPPDPARQVYDPVKAAQMVRMMEAVIQRGTGARAAFGRPAAGKTGTSQSWRDAWFVGFTPDWVCGVWVGNDDSKPMNHVAGGDLPAEIWRRFMLTAHEGLPAREFPFLGGGAAGQGASPGAGSQGRAAFYQGLAADFASAAAAGGGAGTRP